MANTLTSGGATVTSANVDQTILTYNQAVSGLFLSLRVANINPTQSVNYTIKVGGRTLLANGPLPVGAADEHVVNALPVVIENTETLVVNASAANAVDVSYSIVERT